MYNGQLGVATDENSLYYMRSRYYNPDIKRFINQDVLIGNIGNSNSLNRYSYVEGNPVSYTDPFGLSPYGNFGTFLTVMKFMSQIDIMSLVHVTLSALGALPGCTWLNFINAGLYLAEQNYAEACKSLLFGLANLDWLTGAAKFAVSIGKYTEDLGLILKGIDLGLHLLACCQSATDFGTIAAGMIDKYLVNGEDVTWKIALEFLMLAGTGLQLGLLTHSLTGKLSTTFGGSSLDGGGISSVTNSKHVQDGAGGIQSNDGYRSDAVLNWKGQEVILPDGHIMSPRDPSFSSKPITESGPYTSAQRNSFLTGNSAGTKLAPHHRHQIPVRDGGVIDEIPGPGHPSGNQHTAGSPSRHPAKSVFNNEPGGNKLRAYEINQHWKNKGNRLVEIEPGVWVDPGF